MQQVDLLVNTLHPGSLFKYFSIIHNFSPLELSFLTSQIPHFFSSLI